MDFRVGVPPPSLLNSPIRWVWGDVAHTTNSHAAFCSSSGALLLMPMPVPPYMSAVLAGPVGSFAYPTLPASFDASIPAANSCQLGVIASSPALKASSTPLQSQVVLPGCAMLRSLL